MRVNAACCSLCQSAKQTERIICLGQKNLQIQSLLYTSETCYSIKVRLTGWLTVNTTISVKGVPPTDVFRLSVPAVASPMIELKVNWFLFHSSMTETSSPSTTMVTRACAALVRYIHLEKLLLSTGMILCDVAMVRVGMLVNSPKETRGSTR